MVLEHASGIVVGVEVKLPRPSALMTSGAFATWQTGLVPDSSLGLSGTTPPCPCRNAWPPPNPATPRA